MKLRKKILIGAMGGLMCLSLAACGNQTVATTNGGKITRTAFYNKMKNTSLGKNTLLEMILNKLLSKDYGKYVKSSEVTSMFNQYKAHYGSSALLNEALQEQQSSPAELKRGIRLNLLIQQAIKHNTTFTHAMLKKQFKNFQPKVTISVMSIPSQSKAQSAESKLSSGDSFSSVAKDYSKGGASEMKMDNTAKIGSAKLKSKIFNLSQGKYTKTPIKTQEGYMIIKMVNKPEKGTLEDNKSALENQITMKKANDPTIKHKIMSKVLRNGNVNIQDNSLKNILSEFVSTPSSN